MKQFFNYSSVKNNRSCPVKIKLPSQTPDAIILLIRALINVPERLSARIAEIGFIEKFQLGNAFSTELVMRNTFTGTAFIWKKYFKHGNKIFLNTHWHDDVYVMVAGFRHDNRRTQLIRYAKNYHILSNCFQNVHYISRIKPYFKWLTGIFNHY